MCPLHTSPASVSKSWWKEGRQAVRVAAHPGRDGVGAVCLQALGSEGRRYDELQPARGRHLAGSQILPSTSTAPTLLALPRHICALGAMQVLLTGLRTEGLRTPLPSVALAQERGRAQGDLHGQGAGVVGAPPGTSPRCCFTPSWNEISRARVASGSFQGTAPVAYPELTLIKGPSSEQEISRSDPLPDWGPSLVDRVPGPCLLPRSQAHSTSMWARGPPSTCAHSTRERMPQQMAHEGTRAGPAEGRPLLCGQCAMEYRRFLIIFMLTGCMMYQEPFIPPFRLGPL